MLNLVRRLSPLALSLSIASPALAQDLTPLPEASAESNSAFQISAAASNGGGPRLDIWHSSKDGSGRWIAVLDEHGSQSRVDELSCLPFKASMNAFASLPTLRPGPSTLRRQQAGPQQIPNRRLLATSWRIRLPAYAPDNSYVTMDIVGDQGPYAGWVNDTIAAISRCPD